MPRAGPRRIAKYSRDFKLAAVRLSHQAELQGQAVAAALDIHPFMLSKWRKEVRGITLDQAAIKSRWDAIVDDVLSRATLVRPADGPMQRGGRTGRHTEHLGHLLATMQSVARPHPGARW